MQAPVACAFLLLTDQMAVPLSKAVQPPVALDLAAAAMADLYPWADDHEERKVAVVERARGLRDLVPRLLNHPDASWWFAPLERDQQVWLGTSRDQTRTIEVPTASPPAREGTPQMPKMYFLTATEYWERTALHSLLAQWAGDWDPEFPLPQAELRVNDSARVFEICSPRDWYSLAGRYAAIPAGQEATERGRRIFPHWAQVAEDWDIVHLSFGGFLLAMFVPVVGPSGSAKLWTWESESALWLRPSYSEWIDREPLRQRPRTTLGGAGARIRGLEFDSHGSAKRLERWQG